MATKELRTFRDFQDAIMESLKLQSTDTVSRDRVKRNLNMSYQEIVSAKNWTWARGSKAIATEPYIGSGTALVTAGSVNVTLTVAPVSSMKGYVFSANGYNEVYKIQSHTAGALILTLETPFSGSSATASAYKIWNESIPLPSDCSETLEVRHAFSSVPVENLGLQDFRRMVEVTPKAEGRPSCYTTSEYVDPDPFTDISGLPATVSRTSTGLIKKLTFASSVTSFFSTGDRIEVSGAGDYSYNVESIVSNVDDTNLYYTSTVGGTEAAITDTGILVKELSSPSFDRYRKMFIYPAISQYRTSVQVDYKKIIPPLINDTDEPVIPMSDRMILYYGGMWLSNNREKNPEDSDKFFALMDRRLAKMSSKVEDTVDKAQFKVSRAYLQVKRQPSRSRDISRNPLSSGGGGNSSSTVTGTASTVAVFDSSGVLVGSSAIDLTELGFLADNEGLSSTTIAANTTANVTTWTVSSFNTIILDYSISRGSTREAGHITIASDGSTASVATGAVSTIGAPGVSLTTDVSSGQLRLRAAVDNSQPSASALIKWKAQKWLSV